VIHSASGRKPTVGGRNGDSGDTTVLGGDDWEGKSGCRSTTGFRFIQVKQLCYLRNIGGKKTKCPVAYYMSLQQHCNTTTATKATEAGGCSIKTRKKFRLYETELFRVAKGSQMVADQISLQKGSLKRGLRRKSTGQPGAAAPAASSGGPSHVRRHVMRRSSRHWGNAVWNARRPAARAPRRPDLRICPAE